MFNTAADRTFAIYCPTQTGDFYGFGANSAALLAHAATYHRWYLSSKGDTTGTMYMELSSSLLTAPALTLNMAKTGINTPALKFNGVTFNQNYYISVTEGGAVSTKAVILDSNKNYSGVRNFYATNVNASTLVSGTSASFGSVNISGTTDSTSTTTKQ